MLMQTSMFKKFIYVSALAATLSGGLVPHAARAEIRSLEQATSQHDQIVHQLVYFACTADATIANNVKNMFFDANQMNAEGMALGTVIASTPTAQLQAMLENLSYNQYIAILEQLVTNFFDQSKAKPFYLTPSTSQKNIFVALGKSILTCASRSPQINQAIKAKLMTLIQSLYLVEQVNDASLKELKKLDREFSKFTDLLPAHIRAQLPVRGGGYVAQWNNYQHYKAILEQRINN